MFSFLNNIVNALNQVINFFKAFFDVIITICEMIPNPFRTITGMFIPIIIAAIIYKIRR